MIPLLIVLTVFVFIVSGIFYLVRSVIRGILDGSGKTWGT